MVDLTTRDADKSFTVPTGEPRNFKLTRFTRHLVEIADEHFHTDSAVLMPDVRKNPPDPSDDAAKPRASLFTALAKALRFAEQGKDGKRFQLLVAGHADTTGGQQYNVLLTEKRALNALHMLMGHRDDWIKSCDGQHQLVDVKHILKWIGRDWGWDCDPGPLDNTPRQATTDAIKSFEQRFNAELTQAPENAPNAPEDGRVKKELWGAFYDCYQRELKEVLDVHQDGLEALRGKVVFLDEDKGHVGCGYSFPIEEQDRMNFESQTNRRVELVFFAEDELPKLACHPHEHVCKPKLCEVYNPRLYKTEIVDIDVIAPRVQRIRIHLKPLWKDPALGAADRRLAAKFPFSMVYRDGTRGDDVEVADDGTLVFIADRSKQGFSLEYRPPDERWIASAPPGSTETPAEQWVKTPDVSALLAKKFRVFRLPSSFTTKQTDWTSDDAHYHAGDGEFAGWTETDAEIGAAATPATFTLDPHWSFMKLLYTDRKLRQNLTVPPMMVEVFDKASDAAPSKLTNWITEAQGSQAIPWILQRDAAGAAIKKPDDDIQVRIRTAAGTFVDSSGADAGARKLVTHGGAAAGTDLGLNSGAATNVDMNVPNARRLAFYDLPATWTARGWWARLSGGPGAPAAKEGLFETLAHEATTDDKPLMASLDDLCIADGALNPIPLTTNDRLAIFWNGFAEVANPAITASGLYKPDVTNNQRYFSERVARAKENVNHIVDYPTWTRLVIVNGRVYEVFDKRLGPGHGSLPAGLRLAVQVADTTGISHPDHHASRPGTSSPTPFFSIKPYFQAHHGGSEPGRFDMICLRCCDVSGATGDEEVVTFFAYFRYFVRFNTPPSDLDSKQKKLVVSTQTGVPAQQFIDRLCFGVAHRWSMMEVDPNGNPDPFFNPGTAEIVPVNAAGALDATAKIRGRVVWFLQHVDNAIAHVQVKIFQNCRAYMDSEDGLSQFGDGSDGNPGHDNSLSNGFFTGAHETGHAFSLPDEYIEPTIGPDPVKFPSGTFWTPVPGFDSFWDGAAYNDDGFAMMQTNRTPRGRHFWHVAEWMRLDVDPSHRNWGVNHGGRLYQIKHHPDPTSKPIKSHYTDPLAKERDHTNGERGKYDTYLFHLGDDLFSGVILPNYRGGEPATLPPGDRFDGLLLTEVRIHFSYDVSTNAPAVVVELDDLGRRIKNRYCNRMVVRGSSHGVTFKNCLIHFSVRFLVSSFSDDSPSLSRHFSVDVESAGGTFWNNNFPHAVFGPSRTLSFQRGQTQKFLDAFAQMIGIDDGHINDPEHYRGLVNPLFPGATIARIA